MLGWACSGAVTCWSVVLHPWLGLDGNRVWRLLEGSVVSVKTDLTGLGGFWELLAGVDGWHKLDGVSGISRVQGRLRLQHHGSHWIPINEQCRRIYC
jgi:hypothetical protein